jgi:hypothetical protein
MSSKQLYYVDEEADYELIQIDEGFVQARSGGKMCLILFKSRKDLCDFRKAFTNLFYRNRCTEEDLKQHVSGQVPP